MIQQDYKNNVKSTHGTIETTGFNIEVNESMFQMLTSNVYNDTKLAVMREWSTNACDACIAAGKPVKFDVHLPTMEKTEFSVRDYGTGLPPEDIKGLFSNLGASTKRNSNAYNGTLGIGRMAGLAVADAFTVESFYEGTHYSYAISMQNGVPVTIHMGSESTSEPNGLKLAVGLEFDDISVFKEKAEQLYKYFDHKPNLNRDDVDIELDVSEHISDDWFLLNGRGSYRDSNYVVMSQVAYEIPYNREVITQGFNNLVIKAPPGAVTFNPGRESLSLNKSTIEYLNEAFSRISKEYVEAANDALEATSNDAELMTTYSSLIRACPRELVSLIKPQQYASDDYKSLFSSRSSAWGSSQIATFDYLAADTAFNQRTNYSLSLSFKNNYYKNSKPFNQVNPHSWRDFFFSPHVVIDVKSKFRAALNEHFSHSNLITWAKSSTSSDIDESVKTATDMLKRMGIPYRLASELIDQETFVAKEKAAPREGFYASEYCIHSETMRKSEKMEDSDVETVEYLYVKLKNTTPIMSGDKDFYDYMHAYQLLQRTMPVPKVKGVAKKYQSYIEDMDNWIDFETYVEEKMKEATFKVPSETPIPRINSRVINAATCYKYPEDIQVFYNEVTDYYAFVNKTDCLTYALDHLKAKVFEANFEEYEPTREVDMEHLETTYPKSLDFITNKTSFYDMDHEIVAYIANLEAFYAVHSPE